MLPKALVTEANSTSGSPVGGRVAAPHSPFSWGGPRLGEFQTGLAASLIGIRATPVIGGIGCIIVALGVAKLIPAATGLPRYRQLTVAVEGYRSQDVDELDIAAS